jgi:hypothetical protein
MLVFVGDISLAEKNTFDIQIPSKLANRQWIANLEGAVVKNVEPYLEKSRVLNDFYAIGDFSDNLNIHFSLCNNHILDNDDIKETINNLNELGLSYFGAGKTLDEASIPLKLTFEKDNILIMTFGWEVIECPLADKNKAGVNPLTDDYVLSEFSKYQELYPGWKILIFFHWDYELETFPLPSQRKLAFDLIDKGCEGIIGAHPHRVQGAEIHKGKPIIYSVGNWAFQQRAYFRGKLTFPEFCNIQLAFEYCADGNHQCHFFTFDRLGHTVKFLYTEELMSSTTLDNLTPFSGMSNTEYDNWFSLNRFHKKLIPVYRTTDNKLTAKLKNHFNFIRTSLINFLVYLRVK